MDDGYRLQFLFEVASSVITMPRKGHQIKMASSVNASENLLYFSFDNYLLGSRSRHYDLCN